MVMEFEAVDLISRQNGALEIGTVIVICKNDRQREKQREPFLEQRKC